MFMDYLLTRRLSADTVPLGISTNQKIGIGTRRIGVTGEFCLLSHFIPVSLQLKPFKSYEHSTKSQELSVLSDNIFQSVVK